MRALSRQYRAPPNTMQHHCQAGHHSCQPITACRCRQNSPVQDEEKPGLFQPEPIQVPCRSHMPSTVVFLCCMSATVSTSRSPSRSMASCSHRPRRSYDPIIAHSDAWSWSHQTEPKWWECQIAAPARLPLGRRQSWYPAHRRNR